MSKPTHKLWMIAYDISDQKTRREVSKNLQNHGLRVQYSVFECRLKKTQLLTLRKQLSKLIESTDTIRWYPLCSYCEATIHWQGKGNSTEKDEFYIL